MRNYPYHPELKPPDSLAGIDFSNPGMAPAIRLLVRSLQQQTADFTPPEGVRCRWEQLRTWDGAAIRCCVLEPEGCEQTLPGMLYCHGGGFFLPIQPMMLSLAASYAREAGLRVFLPEYRHLPEHPSPYPFRDCLAVWDRIQEKADAWRVDPKRILLYGESAGGTLAAGLALWLRDRKGTAPAGQLLIYPALDNRSSRYPSVRAYSEAAWSLKNNLTMWREYLKNGDDGLGSCLIPMKAEDVRGLAPAYIEAQQIDMLRDEALAYAQRLGESGNHVTCVTVSGSYHGFDADTENPFVQKIRKQRIREMESMLQTHSI